MNFSDYTVHGTVVTNMRIDKSELKRLFLAQLFDIIGLRIGGYYDIDNDGNLCKFEDFRGSYFKEVIRKADQKDIDVINVYKHFSKLK